MLFDIFIIVRVFSILYTWLDHNIVDSILNFSRIFGNLLVLMGVVIFFLIVVYITIKNLKKLPKFYVIKIIDIDGNDIILEGVRTQFLTYDAARHYSEFYQDIYKKQYKFHVVGSNKRYDLGFIDVASLSRGVFKHNRDNP